MIPSYLDDISPDVSQVTGDYVPESGESGVGSLRVSDPPGSHLPVYCWQQTGLNPEGFHESPASLRNRLPSGGKATILLKSPNIADL